jgi:acetyl esterase/lipase
MFYSESSQNSEGNSAIALFHGGGWVLVILQNFMKHAEDMLAKDSSPFHFNIDFQKQ